jgi:hypothetical protein
MNFTMKGTLGVTIQKTYGYGIFSFCEINGHAHNFGGFYFESL